MASPLERAILVTDIPYITDDVEQLKDKLEAYFGKRGNGGGDIQTIICPVAGSIEKAIVIFESTEGAVPDRVIQHEKHTFEDGPIKVEKLPPIYTHIVVELDRYYWDILPRENATKLIRSLKLKLGDTNIVCDKYKIDKIKSSLDELEAVKEKIPKAAGIGSSNIATASTVTSDILAKSVEVNNIPYVTDDVNKLKTYLKEDINQGHAVRVEDVITPIEGNMKRAIIVFESTEDKEKYEQQAKHPFKGEDLTIRALPEVFQKATAKLDKFYQQLIPKTNVDHLHAKLTKKYGLDITLTRDEITGPIRHIAAILTIWIEAIGLQPRTISEFESKKPDEAINSETESDQIIHNSALEEKEGDAFAGENHWHEKGIAGEVEDGIKIQYDHLMNVVPKPSPQQAGVNITDPEPSTSEDLANDAEAGPKSDENNEPVVKLEKSAVEEPNPKVERPETKTSKVANDNVQIEFAEDVSFDGKIVGGFSKQNTSLSNREVAVRGAQGPKDGDGKQRISSAKSTKQVSTAADETSNAGVEQQSKKTLFGNGDAVDDLEYFENNAMSQHKSGSKPSDHKSEDVSGCENRGDGKSSPIIIAANFNRHSSDANVEDNLGRISASNTQFGENEQSNSIETDAKCKSQDENLTKSGDSPLTDDLGSLKERLANKAGDPFPNENHSYKRIAGEGEDGIKIQYNQLPNVLQKPLVQKTAEDISDPKPSGDAGVANDVKADPTSHENNELVENEPNSGAKEPDSNVKTPGTKVSKAANDNDRLESAENISPDETVVRYSEKHDTPLSNRTEVTSVDEKREIFADEFSEETGVDSDIEELKGFRNAASTKSDNHTSPHAIPATDDQPSDTKTDPVQKQAGVHVSDKRDEITMNKTAVHNATPSAIITSQPPAERGIPPKNSATDTKWLATKSDGYDSRSEKKQFRNSVDQSLADKSNNSNLTPLNSPTASSDADHIDDYISVDTLTYAYIKKTCAEKLKEITSICNIQIQIPDQQKPTEQIASFIPKQSTSANDLTEAREKFISLYQATFFKLKRQSLKCDTVPKVKAERAKEAAETTINDIVIVKEKSQEYVFCGEEKTVAEAIDVFREIADMKPKRRRLKKPNSDVEVMPVIATNRQQNQNLPSVFYSPEGIEVIVLNADITKQKVDAIVNAANGRLNHGGGVAGAISRAAGSQLQRDCDRLMAGRANVQVGQCVETKSYRLPCRYIIHAVGPTYDSTNAQRFFQSLVNTFTNVLKYAESKQSKTLAIPLISSGNFGGPKETCTNALASAIYNFSSSNKRRCLQQICLVNIDQESTLALQNTLSELYPAHKENQETKAEDPDGLDESFTTLKSSIKYKTDEGIEIVVCKGDITKGDVEVIVNAANGKLNHGSGVAGAIARAAGKKIQDESHQIIAQRKRPLQVGECTVTDGYNLRCKVIHAVGPIFKKFKSKDFFFDMLKKTFLEAIRYANVPIEAKQVAIPLISSGIFGGPKDLCAKALAEAVKEFSRNEKTLVIKRIYLVNIDEETTDAVRVAIQALFPPGTAADQLKVETNPGTTEPVQKKTRTDGQHIMSKKGIVLDVLCDDITKQEVDVIVNPTSPTLRHNGGVAGAISDAAGVKLQRRCNYILKEQRKNNPLSIGDTVVTSAFGLPCKHIIHTLGPAFDALTQNDFRRSLQSTFLNCLRFANSNMQVKTITFPLIGSREGPTEICASAFVEAIRELDRSELQISLNKITLVTTDEDSYVTVQKNLTANFQPALPQNGVEEHPSARNSNADATPSTLDEDTEYAFKTAESVDLIVRTGNIAKESADVIINSTDDTLSNTGDISKSICKEAGPKLQKECKQEMQKRNGSPLKPGENVPTDAYALPCRKVLHVSCPVRKGNQSDGVFAGFLRRTYLACLCYARKELKAKCIAIPLIGSEQESESLCATATANAVKQFSLQANAGTTQLRVLFVNSRQTSTTAIKNAFSSQFKLVTETVRDTHKENGRHGQFSSIESRGSSHIAIGATDEATQQPIKRKKEMEMRMTSNQGSNTRSQQHSVSPEPEKPNEQASNPTGAKRKKRPTDKKSSQLHSQRCQICKDDTKRLHPLEGCKHIYCNDCIRNTITPASACQDCGELYGVEWENHFDGKITYYVKKDITLKGNRTPGTICMVFSLPSGIQKTGHPRPNSNYFGMTIQAYLPASEEGRGVLWLLRLAFLKGMLFQIYSSQNKRGRQSERVGLAGIPLKTETNGKDGYPDPDYLNRVKEILKAKGIDGE